MQRNLINKINLLLALAFFSIPIFAASNANQAVDKVVKTYMQAYESRDLNTLANLHSPKAMVIGTGSDEIMQGREQIVAGLKRDFAQSTTATINAEKIAIHVQGNFAVASYYLTVNVKIPNNPSFQSKLRCTLGLFKENNQWLIAQSHFSAPLAEQKIGKSFPNA